jgi:hypothetical protein
MITNQLHNVRFSSSKKHDPRPLRLTEQEIKDCAKRIELNEIKEQKRWFKNGVQHAGDALITPFGKAKQAMSKWSWFWGPTVR